MLPTFGSADTLVQSISPIPEVLNKIFLACLICLVHFFFHINSIIQYIHNQTYFPEC